MTCIIGPIIELLKTLEGKLYALKESLSPVLSKTVGFAFFSPNRKKPETRERKRKAKTMGSFSTSFRDKKTSSVKTSCSNLRIYIPHSHQSLSHLSLSLWYFFLPFESAKQKKTKKRKKLRNHQCLEIFCCSWVDMMLRVCCFVRSQS